MKLKATTVFLYLTILCGIIYLLLNLPFSNKLSLENYFLDNEVNLLVPLMILSKEISIKGWSSSNARKIGKSCNEFTLFGGRPNISMIYQYVPIREQSNVTGVEFSFTSMVLLLPQNNSMMNVSSKLCGALLRVKLNNGFIHTEKIERLGLSPEPGLLESRYLYQAPPNNTVASVTVMLATFDFPVEVTFSKINLIPKIGNANFPEFITRNELLDYCKVPKQRITRSYDKRVLEINKAHNRSISCRELLTLTTQLSEDRLYRLSNMTNIWKGPVSVVIYVTERNRDQEIIQIKMTLKSLNLHPMSTAYVVYGDPHDDQYPINYLRNLAMENCQTEFCFIADADFIPSPDFNNQFFSLLEHIRNEDISNTAFVVPAFEFTLIPNKSENSMPQNKKQLIKTVLSSDLIQPFHHKKHPIGHNSTDYEKWYKEVEPYYVNGFHKSYEPYLILKKTKTMPKFDERFRGYGKNKISFIAELFLAKYKFLVTPENWMIHQPHEITTSRELFFHVIVITCYYSDFPALADTKFSDLVC